VAPLTRVRVTDRATGEVLGDHESVDPPQASPRERPLVLPLDDRRSARAATAVEVVVDGWRFELEVEDARLADLRGRATAGRAVRTHDGPLEVRAIIPGRVLSVAVTVGDVVTAGQRLLAVEAMKMENELRAPRDGTVERVTAVVGQTVDPGDSLVVLR
jgi:biotin carboxyl carrier protein